MKLLKESLFKMMTGKPLVAKTIGIATVLSISAILFFIVFIKLGALSATRADLDVFLNGERLDVVTLNQSTYLPSDTIEVDTGKVPTEAVNISLLDPKGREVAATLVDIEDGKDSTAQLNTSGDMVPGKYQLTVKSKTRENEIKQVDFRWGVLAINIDKSSYSTGENVSFSLGSLDDKGSTLCDSNLQLSVTSPSGILTTLATVDNTIIKNPSCGPNNVTDLPDYSAKLSNLQEEGKYSLIFKNVDNNYEIKSSITVNNTSEFIIERRGATRINPFLSKYKMYIGVEAKSDFSGLIVEKVPANFEISKSEEYIVRKSEDGSSQILWQRTLNAGGKEFLTYEYQAPKISPELFVLGSLSLTNLQTQKIVFEEERQWELASDSVATVVDGSSASGSLYPAQRRIVRTTNGTNGKRTFSIGYDGTGLNLYYTDDPDAGSPTWSTVGSLRNPTTSHTVADMVWDEVNNSLYIVYGRNTTASGGEVDYNRVSSLNGASCNDTASNCDIGARINTAIPAPTDNYTHPLVEIGYDSGTRKIFIFGSTHVASAAPSAIVVSTGTINVDSPTWDTLYTIKSWTASTNAGLLGVTRSNNDRLIVQYYDGTNISAVRHDDASDAQATSGWDALDGSDNSQTTISGDDPGARAAGSVSGATNSTAVWFSWLDGSSDINTRRWNGTSLDTEMTPIAAANGNVVGPALTTNDSTLYMVYQDETDNTKLVYQSRSFTDGTTAWNGTETTLEDHATENLTYPSVAARTNQSKLDVIYTTATTFLVRQTSVSVTVPYNISGVAYVDEAGTLWTGAGKCDGSTNSISISVNGGTKQSTTCNGTTGAFSLDVTAPSAANQIITVFMDTNGGDKGVSYIKNNDTTTNITNVLLFKNHIFLQSESSQSITNANISTYDAADDSDIPVTMSGANLTGSAGVELYINDSDTYAPGGNVTVDYMDVDGAYSGGSETLEIFGTGTGTSCGDAVGSGRPLCNRGGAGWAFTAPTTVNFTGTANTVLEAGDFINLGVGTTSDSSAGATFTLWNDITVSGTLTVGNASSTNTDTLNGGTASDYITFTGNGTPFNITSKGSYVANTSHIIYDATTGSTTIAGTTYNDLYIDATSDVAAGLTYTLGGNITVNGNLYLGNDSSTNTDTLNGSSYTMTFTGSTTPFNIRSKGSFVAATSTVNYTGSSATALATTNYNNLGVGTTSDSGAAVTYTLGGTITVSGVLTVGNASSTNTDTFNGGAGANFITFTGTGTVFNITSKGSYVANASHIIYDSTGNATVAGTTYNDLYIDSVDDVTAGGTYTLGGNTTVSGTLYLGGSSSTNTDTLDGSSYTLTFTGSGTPFGIRTKGAFTASTSTVNYTGSSATALAIATYYNLGVGTTSDVAAAVTYTLGGNTTVTNVLTVGNASSTNTDVLAGSSFTLTLSGSGTPFVITSKGSFTGGTSTVSYLGTSATALAAATYYNLGVGTTSDVAAAVTYTLGGNTTVSNVLTVGNASSTNTDVLAASTFTLTLSGSSTPLNITSKGSFTANTSTVNYIGSSSTNVASTSYYNLGAGTTSDALTAVTYTLLGNTTVSNVLTVGNASSTNTDVLSASSFTLTLSGSGTPFVITSKGSFTSGTSTVNYIGSSATALAIATYYNLGVGTTSDVAAAVTYTLGGNTTVTNVLTVGNASSTNTDVLAASTYTLTLLGSGTPFVITSKGSLTANTSTISYLGTSATALAATTYYNLEVGTTSDVAAAVTYTLGGNTTVSNVLTVGNASSTNTDVLAGSSFTLTLTGSGTPFVKTSKGTFSYGTSTVNYTGTSTTSIASSAYYNLGIGTTADSNAVTYSTLGSTQVYSVLTVGNASSTGAGDTLNLGSTNLFLFGSGTPLVVTSKGTLNASTSNVIFDPTTNTSIPALTYYNLIIENDFITGGQTVTLGTASSQTITIGNDFSVGSAGTSALTVNASTYSPVIDINRDFAISVYGTFIAPSSMTVARNFTNNGVFTHNSGAIIFDDNTKTSVISGSTSTTFNNFTSTTAGKTINFKKQTSNSPVFTVAGTFTLTGGSGNLINLSSDTNGTQWLAHFNTDQTNVTYTSIKDSGCDVGTALVANSSTNTDGGNNGTCWGALTVAGNVYSDEAVSPTVWSGAGKCDGSSAVISVTVNGGTKRSTTCNGTTGAFTVLINKPSAANQVLALFLDTTGGDKGVVYTKNNDTTSNITGIKLTKNRVWVQSESSESITGYDIGNYDKDNDGDIPVTASGLTVAYDNKTTATQNSGSSLSFSHTVSGTNRLLILGVSYRSSSISSITYNSVSMTKIRSDVATEFNQRRTDLWYLTAPSTGSNTVNITFNADAADVVAGAISFTGVNQTDPLGNNAGNTGSSISNPTTPNVTLTSNPSELAFAVMALYPNGNANTETANADQTDRWSTTSGTNNIRGIGSTKIGATSVNIGWTTTQSFDWSVSGVAIKSLSDPIAVDSGVELHINTGDTFAPGINISTDYLHIKGTYSGSTETLTLSGAGTGACSTEPGTIKPLCLDSGTFTAPNVVNFTTSAGNVSIEGTTYNNLGVGTEADSNAGRTFTLSGNLTIGDTLIIGNESSTNTDTLYGGASTILFTHSINSWGIRSKGVFDPGTSTIRYEGSAQNVAAITYYDLNIISEGRLSLSSGNTIVNGDFIIGNGSSFTSLTTDPSTALDVTGDVIISTYSSFAIDPNASLYVAGGWTNNGSFTGSSGTVIFDGTSGGNVISGDLTESNKFNNVIFNGVGGSWSINSNIEIEGDLNLMSGNLTQGANADIFTTGNITLAEGTTFTKASGTGKFKMDGPTGTQIFTDNHASKVNLGHVQVGASPGTTTLASDMLATDLTIPTSDTFNTKGFDVTVTDFFDCQGTCVLDTTDTGPNNEGDGTRIAVGGNWTMSSSATFTSTSSTLEFNGTVNQTVTTGGKSFNNVTVNNTGTTNQTITVSGNLTIPGSLTLTDGTLDLNTNDPVTDIDNDLTINSGAVLSVSNSSSLTIGDDFSNSGTFTHNNGTITFDTTSTANISGATTFNNFTSTTAGKTLQFQKHTANTPVFTFAGTVTIIGASGNKINVQSDTNSVQWLAHFNTAQSNLSYITIKDSGCDVGSASIAENSTNSSSGNNSYCWSVDKPTFSESSWFNSSWTKRKKITIDETKIPGTTNLTNFPLLVSRTDTDIRDNAQSDGDDIVFTLSDGKTKLSHEIEKYVSASGELIAWVKIPSLKAMVNSDLYIYYGNSDAQNQQNASDVWSSNFKAVYHMKETPTGTSGDIKDSTTVYNASSASMSSGDQVTGKIDGALNFDSTDNYVNTGLNSYYTSYTFESWVKWDSCGENNKARIFAKHQSNPQTMLLYCDDSYGGRSIDFQRVYSGSTAEWYVHANDLPAFGTVLHVVVTYTDGAANDPIIYINGVAKPIVEIVSPSGTITNNSDNYIIGNRSAQDRTWDGYIDEFRISDTIRSADWITAEYNNQDSPSTFYSVASQETKPVSLPAPLLQKKVTAGSTMGTYGWTNETQVQFVATASDPNSSDTLYLCVEKDLIATSFSGTEDSCGSGTSYSGSPVTVTQTINGLTDTAQYHWQARIKDASGAYSDWVEYNAGSDVEVARDTFTRGGSDTWGTATLGGGYTLGSSASHFDLNSTEATIDVDFADTQYFTSLQNINVQNVDATVRVKVDKIPAGSYGAAYIRARYGSSSGYYRARLKFNNTGNSIYVQGQQFTNAGGTTVDIGSDTQVSGLSYSTNNYIWMRAQFTGVSPTTIKIKAWADGTSEPSTWTYTATDSTAALQTSGAVGLMARLNTGVSNAPVLFSYDDLSVKTTDETRDFGIDTTAPTTGGVIVYDGTTIGTDGDQNDTGSLSLLSANWTTFGTNVSGLDKYQYSIGTSAGTTDTKSWTDFDATTSINVSGLSLHTAQPYFFNVRAVDNAENTSSVISSNGQYVTATLTFSLSSNSITFTNLSPSNNNQDTKTTSVTTSTNAYNGYEIKAYRTGLMSNGTNTIQDFGGGSYANPGTWGTGQCNGASCGYGYTTSDTTIGGVDKFASNTKFAPFASSGPGDVVADHTQSVTGTAIANESFTITNKVAVPLSQPSGTYTTTIVYTVVPQY